MTSGGWIDELEAELGLTARLRLVANAGGQRRRIPQRGDGSTSQLAEEVGADVVQWLVERFGGDMLEIPSDKSVERSDKAARLIADVLEAGLTDPTRSANDLARAHGVSRRWIVQLRRELRAERSSASPQLDLFAGELLPPPKARP